MLGAEADMRKSTRSKATARRTLKDKPRHKLYYCLKCGKTVDGTICHVHHVRTYGNSWIRRFPRSSEGYKAALKAAKKAEKKNEDAWVTKPYQGGLMNGK
jgi:hypothetical protein